MPSELAAASVAVARMQCGVSPHWPHTLSALAGFPTSDDAPPVILSCCSHLLGLCHFEKTGADRSAEPDAVEVDPEPTPEDKARMAGAAAFGSLPPAADSRRPFKPLNAPSSFGAPGPAKSGWRHLHHGAHPAADAMEE